MSLNILVSYYIKKAHKKAYNDILLRINEANNAEVLIDSGAYSAWNSGAEIVLDEYCDACREYESKGWKYFQLDVIGDQKKTLDNYDYMISKGLTPIPVFTRGGNLQDLKQIKDAQLIGLGSGVRTKGQGAYIKWFLMQEKEIKNTQLHLFGYNNLKTVFTNKIYSIDSTSWAQGGVMNFYRFFDEKKLRFFDRYLKNKSDIDRLFRHSPEIVKQNMGEDINLLLENQISVRASKWEKKRFEIGVMAYLKYAKTLYKINKVKYYFAMSLNTNINEQLISVYNRRGDLQ